MSIENTRQQLRFLGALLLGVGLLVSGYLVFDQIRYAHLEKLPLTNLGIVEEQQLRSADLEVFNSTAKKVLPTRALASLSTEMTQKLTFEAASKLASELGFAAEATRAGNIYIWSQGQRNFLADLGNQTLALTTAVISQPEAGIKEFPPREDVDVLARSTLSKLGLSSRTLDFEKPAVSYSSEEGVEPGEGGDASKSQRAKRMTVSYPLRAGGIDIVGPLGASQSAQIQVNEAGDLVGFAVPWHPFAWQDLGDYPLKSTGDALNDIKKGKGSIVSLTTIEPSRDTQKQKTINLMNFTDVSLGLFAVEGEKSYLVPVYVFSGKASFTSGEVANIKIYILAVKDRFIEK
jgi:hypothetical protein